MAGSFVFKFLVQSTRLLPRRIQRRLDVTIQVFGMLDRDSANEIEHLDYFVALSNGSVPLIVKS